MSLLQRIDQFIDDRFHLSYDQANIMDIINDVNEGISFRGANVWILIMAIIICSVGLNMNSTAVVIGAMLLSPLMGPIIGFGVAVSRYDLDTVVKSGRNLLLAAVVSIVIATCYFTLSPLTSPTSEIIARTSPTIWDVIIALCGGVAGIIAVTRKEKSLTVIPGVAIATALMPPLCTAGFGIANGMWMFTLRALYLFCVNSVFIAAATFMMSKYIHFPKKVYSPSNASTPSKVKWSIAMILLVVMIPSVLGATDIVQQNIIDKNIGRFVAQEINAQGGQIISQQIDYDAKRLVFWIIGTSVDADMIAGLSEQLNDYHLSEYQLIVNQGLPSESEIKNQVNTIDQLAQSVQQMQSIIEQQNNQLASVERTVQLYQPLSVSTEQLYQEISALYPQVVSITASIIQSSSVALTRDSDVRQLSGLTVDRIVFEDFSGAVNTGGLQIFDIESQPDDTIRRPYLIVIRSNQITAAEQQLISQWLQTRLGDVDVSVLWEIGE